MLTSLTYQQIRQSTCESTFPEDAREEAVSMLERHERLRRTKDGSVIAIAVDLLPCSLVFKADEIVVERYKLESIIEKRDVGEDGFLVGGIADTAPFCEVRTRWYRCAATATWVVRFDRREDVLAVPCDEDRSEIRWMSAQPSSRKCGIR